MNYHDRLTDRERIRIRAQTKHEQLKAEVIDILIDAVHQQMCGGATVSFDHNLASKIEKLIVGDEGDPNLRDIWKTAVNFGNTTWGGDAQDIADRCARS